MSIFALLGFVLGASSHMIASNKLPGCAHVICLVSACSDTHLKQQHQNNPRIFYRRQAAQNGYAEAVQTLIDHNADINHVQSSDGATAV